MDLRQGWILTLEPERFETRLASGRDGSDVGVGSRHTLKRLAVSFVLDRSVLLFSRSLKRSLQSYELESGVPSPASYLRLASPDRDLLERIPRVTGLRGRALEDILQIMAMVGIETARRRQSFGRLQLSSRESIFAADSRPQCQPSVGP